MMKILVDADACPVKEIIEKVAKQKNIEVVMYIDSSHILSSDYSKIVTISKGRDAVDLALINDSEKGDVIVTQDYGVASLALGRSAYAIGNSGLIYDNNNIDKLMFEPNTKWFIIWKKCRRLIFLIQKRRRKIFLSEMIRKEIIIL